MPFPADGVLPASVHDSGVSLKGNSKPVLRRNAIRALLGAPVPAQSQRLGLTEAE